MNTNRARVAIHNRNMQTDAEEFARPAQPPDSTSWSVVRDAAKDCMACHLYKRATQTVAFIEKVIGWDRASMPSLFAVVPRGEDAVIGYCGFHHHPEVPGEIEIGYRLPPDYWNRGLITEAARAVRNHAFADLKLPRVISLVHPENIPSRRVAEKNGMKVGKQITFRGFPTLVYAITREEWLVKHGAG